MTKRILSILTALMLFCNMAVPIVSAEEKNTARIYLNDQYENVDLFEYNDFTYLIREDKIWIYCYNGKAETVTVPSEIDGKPVVRIWEYAFKDKETVTSVVLPDTVRVIDDAFYSCDNLTSVKLSANITSMEGAFGDCKALTDIELPGTVKNISYAFFGCTSLKSIVLPASVTKMYAAFGSCTALKTATLTNGMKTVGGTLFEGCTSLKSITLPDSIETIRSFAFSGCSSLKSIKLPKNLKTIGADVFYKCKSLKTLTIPKKVQTIKTYWGTFDGCPKLKLRISKKNKFFKVKGNVIFSKDGKTLVYCKDVKRKTYVVPKSVKKIGAGAFAFNTNTKQVVLPKGLKKIASGAFMSCTAKVNLPTTVKTIGDVAFAEARVKKLVLRKNMTIGKSAFRGCKSLKEVEIQAGVKAIGQWAFESCKNLKKVVVLDKKIKLKNSTIGYINDEPPRFVRNVKVYGYKGSSAERFVNEENDERDHNGFSDAPKLKFIAL